MTINKQTAYAPCMARRNAYKFVLTQLSPEALKNFKGIPGTSESNRRFFCSLPRASRDTTKNFEVDLICSTSPAVCDNASRPINVGKATRCGKPDQKASPTMTANKQTAYAPCMARRSAYKFVLTQLSPEALRNFKGVPGASRSHWRFFCSLPRASRNATKNFDMDPICSTSPAVCHDVSRRIKVRKAIRCGKPDQKKGLSLSVIQTMPLYLMAPSLLTFSL